MLMMITPKYPIYVISKNRWQDDRRLTSKALEEMGVNYRIVVEPQEYDDYASVINKDKVLILPFSNLGQGSIPARNWVWEHSISEGHERHWILDDNIKRFCRLNNNQKIKVTSPGIFRAAEDFVDRYENIALAGFQYSYFAPDIIKRKPFIKNTRIYSCILIKNNTQHRWRGRYNEDTDLSLRVLKDGLCTIEFYAFLQDKTRTMSMKGGNTDELYKDDGRLRMASSLREQHPDVVRITKKFSKWHHQVNYNKFKSNKLIKKKDIKIYNRVNNYNMILKEFKGESNEETRIGRGNSEG